MFCYDIGYEFMKIVISSNTAWNIANFRESLIRALVKNGYEVVAVAPSDESASRITDCGARFVSMPMDNKGTNPVRDYCLFLRCASLFYREKPEAFLGFTVKPNVYGGLAARLCGIPSINNVAGLGSVFIHTNWLTQVVEILYRLALARSAKVFFQNKDDHLLFLSRGLVRQEVTDILPGSGVDTEKFSPMVAEEAVDQPFRFLLLARLIRDKGVGEYVEAARGILKKHENVQFQLLGFLDVKNPSAIPRAQIEKWEREGLIEYMGATSDVRPMIAQADCIVLPSYREGAPRSLLEAASMGKPIITTDAVGCRDVVDDGTTGFLCRPRDAEDLALKMEKMLSLSFDERKKMGLRGRQKMIDKFDENIVINKYLHVLNELRRRKGEGA